MRNLRGGRLRLARKAFSKKSFDLYTCISDDLLPESPEYNRAIAEKRVAAVTGALEAKGVDKSRIITHSFGDTAQVHEISHKNRVCVMICK